MKAIVIATRKTITIEPNIGYPGGYVGSDGHHYHDHELQLVVNDDPDYWTRLEHQYAGMAMQGFCANYNDFTKVNDGTCTNVEMICENARIIAHALVEKMKSVDL